MTSQQDPAAWRLPEAGGERLMADPGIAEMVAQLHHERWDHSRAGPGPATKDCGAGGCDGRRPSKSTKSSGG